MPRMILATVAALTWSLPALGQSLSVQLQTMPEAIPGPAHMVGPLDVAYPSEDGAQIPAALSFPTIFEQAVMSGYALTTATELGATAITFPAQSISLLPPQGQIFPCSHGRACTLISTSTVPWPDHQTAPLTLLLDAPVPDPEGGCLTLTGTVSAPFTVSNLAVPASIQALPNIPPPLPTGSPALPFAPLPETYLVQPPMSASLLFTGPVSVLVCGDAETARNGVLDYEMVQAGSDWRWTVRGRWTVTLTDGEAEFTHTLTANETEGRLLSAETGHVGDANGSASPMTGDWLLAFSPGPGLADPVTQVFLEREAAGVGGREIAQQTNHPAVIALSWLFREYAVGTGDILLSETAPEGVDLPGMPPLAPGDPGASLSLHWTFADD